MNFAEEAARIADEVLSAEQELGLPKSMNVRERLLLMFWLALDRGLVRLPKPGEVEEPILPGSQGARRRRLWPVLEPVPVQGPAGPEQDRVAAGHRHLAQERGPRPAAPGPGQEARGDTSMSETAGPRTRGDCLNGPRPCPRVSCRYHLLTMRSRAELRTRSDEELADLALSMPETCALDVADKGGATQEEIGRLLGLTRGGVFMELARIYNRRRALFRARLSGPEEIWL